MGSDDSRIAGHRIPAVQVRAAVNTKTVAV